MRIAIAQMPMAWAIEQNTRVIEENIESAASLDAVVVFPELAVTGFHRGLRDVAIGEVVQAVERIRTACGTHGIAAVLGSPTFAEDTGALRNSTIAIDRHGVVSAVTSKSGLTESEARLFSPGSIRPVFAVNDVPCAALMCREIFDDLWPATSSGPVPRLLFWPSYIRWETMGSGGGVGSDYRARASAVAREHGVFVVQANWPCSLNQPDQRGMGGSLVISPDGEIVLECPLDRAGLFTVDLAGLTSSGIRA